MPRNQQYLTIGRSTNNNMTLRYRTVSQLHAKIKHQDVSFPDDAVHGCWVWSSQCTNRWLACLFAQNNFFLYDALSSNGTMLFLSRPLELEWNKTVHVKIGRTILTLKSKKRWKWAGGAFGEHSDGNEAEYRSSAGSPPPEVAADAFLATPTHRSSANSPPPQAPARAATTSHSRALHRAVPNRFESSSASALSDPSAELVSSPYAVRDLLGRSHGALPASFGGRRGTRADDHALASPAALANSQIASVRLSDLVEEEPFPTLYGARREAQQHRQRARASSAGSMAARMGDGEEMLDAFFERRQHQQQQQQQQDDDEEGTEVYYEIADSFAHMGVADRADDCDLASVGRGGSDVTPLVVSNGADAAGESN